MSLLCGSTSSDASGGTSTRSPDAERRRLTSGESSPAVRLSPPMGLKFEGAPPEGDAGAAGRRGDAPR